MYYINSINISTFCGALSIITIPGRKGYVFKGWSYEENGENQFTFSQFENYTKTVMLDHGAKISYDANGNTIYVFGKHDCCITKEEAQYLNENKKGATLYAIWEKE